MEDKQMYTELAPVSFTDGTYQTVNHIREATHLALWGSGVQPTYIDYKPKSVWPGFYLARKIKLLKKEYPEIKRAYLPRPPKLLTKALYKQEGIEVVVKEPGTSIDSFV